MGADAVLAEVSGVTTTFGRLTRAVAVSALAGALSIPVLIHAQGKPDAFVGTWKLDVDNSVFDPGPPPISRTMTIVAVDNGQTHQIDSMIPLDDKDSSEFFVHGEVRWDRRAGDGKQQSRDRLDQAGRCEEH